MTLPDAEALTALEVLERNTVRAVMILPGQGTKFSCLACGVRGAWPVPHEPHCPVVVVRTELEQARKAAHIAEQALGYAAQEIQGLRGALEWYADKHAYREVEHVRPVLFDEGARARAALAQQQERHE